MKTLITAVLAAAFSMGAVAASHMEKGASAPMGKPMAAPMAAKSGDMAASGAKKMKKAKAVKKAASAPKA